jgi:hypothetical protein
VSGWAAPEQQNAAQNSYFKHKTDLMQAEDSGGGVWGENLLFAPCYGKPSYASRAKKQNAIVTEIIKFFLRHSPHSLKNIKRKLQYKCGRTYSSCNRSIASDGAVLSHFGSVRCHMQVIRFNARPTGGK